MKVKEQDVRQLLKYFNKYEKLNKMAIVEKSGEEQKELEKSAKEMFDITFKHAISMNTNGDSCLIDLLIGVSFFKKPTYDLFVEVLKVLGIEVIEKGED